MVVGTKLDHDVERIHCRDVCGDEVSITVRSDTPECSLKKCITQAWNGDAGACEWVCGEKISVKTLPTNKTLKSKCSLSPIREK